MIRFREVAMLPALVAALIQFLLPFFTALDPETTSVINAGVAFLAALATAFMASAEKGLAFLAGAGNTIVQLALGFGVHLTDAQQSLLATLLTLITAAFTRTQVVAPKPPVPVVQTTDARGQVIQVPNQTGGQL